MNGEIERPDTATILRGLKDFQRDTVEYVFNRLYGENPTPRFLVADEVGLGKTLVARGVIAKAIDLLWDKKDRIDIVYICSNAEIARQNVNRLNVTKRKDFIQSERITLLPLHIRALKKNRLNFISLTPGTSFDLKSSLGHVTERALLYRLLESAWDFHGVAPSKVFQGGCSRERFSREVQQAKQQTIDGSLAKAFIDAVKHHMRLERQEKRPTLHQRFQKLCDDFRHTRDKAPQEVREERSKWIGELRMLLAASCLRALKPDLVILDEFQRFRHLLAGDTDFGRLAKDLFEYDDVRVLLLSATPYKMYTIAQEATEEDHYADFVRTLRFLQFDADTTASFEGIIDDFRRELFRITTSSLGRLTTLKAQLEAALRQVVVRTERLAVSENRDGMLKEMPRDGLKLTASDVATYPKLRKISAALAAGDMLEFWKSAPFLFNFMESYEVKRSFTRALETGTRDAELSELMADAPELLLPWRDIAAYKTVDPGHAGLRKLIADTVGSGAWKLLWLPPSLPYYQLQGAFADPVLSRFTKRLVFSAWHVVPKTIGCLVSYEAERTMFRSHEDSPKNTAEERKRRKPLLRFSRSEGRLTGLPVLSLVYPSIALAELGDPLTIATAPEYLGKPLTVAEIRQIVINRLRPRLNSLSTKDSKGPVDESWYWAAPILLDLSQSAKATREWFEEVSLANAWVGDRPDDDDEDTEAEQGEESAWHAHVQQAQAFLDGEQSLGPQPHDLAEVLADLAIAGPAVSALRALARVSGESGNFTRVALRYEAGQVGHSFLRLFNMPEVTAMIRGREGGERYWQRVLAYAVDGGLQSMLDEYAHVLRDLQGMTAAQCEQITEEVSGAIVRALSIRTVPLHLDEIRTNAKKGTVRLQDRRMRIRFAVRFGEERSSDAERGGNRAEQVRAAFNSPFWPFVLATTSVGQEGLDFHPYCHAVVHWNLPSNPVDLEQREGRVHRYKGHAVRKNLATKYGLSAVGNGSNDPWDGVFAAGVRDRVQGSSDIIPYWVFSLEGGAAIERHLVSFPLSRDAARMEALRRTLAVYRMVFGQSRQEDLVSYLLTQLPKEEIEEIVAQLRIDLSPRPKGAEPKITDTSCLS